MSTQHKFEARRGDLITGIQNHIYVISRLKQSDLKSGEKITVDNARGNPIRPWFKYHGKINGVDIFDAGIKCGVELINLDSSNEKAKPVRKVLCSGLADLKKFYSTALRVTKDGAFDDAIKHRIEADEARGSRTRKS